VTRSIAIISEHASPLGNLGGADSGGQNVYVAQIARHLARRGDRVDVFTRRDDSRLAEIVEWQGCRVIHVPAGPPCAIRKERLLEYMGEFTDYLLSFCSREAAYDCVHANFWMSGLVGADLQQRLGTPLVVTFHALGRVRRQFQGAADQFPDERFAIEERIMQEAVRIIAECPQDVEDQTTLYGADSAKIRIAPCGFDAEEFWPLSQDDCRRQLGIPLAEPVLLQLGRMVERKGVDNVVRAVGLLKRDYQIAARLLIVGGESDQPDALATPEIGRLQQIAAAEAVSDLVTFVGRRGRDVLRVYYNAADVFVTTPWYEPFGITPLEAMACGRPVVGSNVGGIKYTISDGETGYLVPPRDPDALAERLSELFRHPDLLHSMGRKAIRRVNNHFTWRKVTDLVSHIYDEAIEARRSAAAVRPVSKVDGRRQSNGRHSCDQRGSAAIFLDKDGTIINDVPYNVDLELIELAPGAIEGLRRFSEAGYRLIVVSNQSGVAHGFFPEDALIPVERRLREMLAQAGISLDGFYYCPHHPQAALARYRRRCACRKPAPGLVRRAVDEHEIDLARSWFIGDILDDVETGRRAGCHTALIDNGHETHWQFSPSRVPDLFVADLSEAASMILGHRGPAAELITDSGLAFLGERV
jgi:D,D-heptose 1,7-bisphosphate phosphatase